MTGREATSVRRDRLVLATALLVLAVVALGLGRLALNRPVDGAPHSSPGGIDLLTDDTRARVTVRLSLSADHATDDALVISLGVTSRRDEVAFALVLSGGAARTGIEARSASALPRRHGDVWVGQDAVDAWFVNSAGPTLVNFGPPAPSAVIVGHARRSAPNGPIQVSMVVPTTGELARHTASGLEFHLPAVGSREGWFQNLVLSARADDRRAAAAAADLIENVDWQPPKAFHAVVVLSGLGGNDRVDAVPPATSVGPGQRTWQRSGTLEVTGIVDRADDIRRAQHRQLVAGAALGSGGVLLAGSLAIFAGVCLDRSGRGLRAIRCCRPTRG